MITVQRFQAIRGCSLWDGSREFGEIVDVLFDTITWRVRFLVILVGRMFFRGRTAAISIEDAEFPERLGKNAAVSVRPGVVWRSSSPAEVGLGAGWGQSNLFSTALTGQPGQGALHRFGDTGHFRMISRGGVLLGRVTDMIIGSGWAIRKLAVEPVDDTRQQVLVGIDAIDRMLPTEGVIATRLSGMAFRRLPQGAEPVERTSDLRPGYDPLWDSTGGSRIWMR